MAQENQPLYVDPVAVKSKPKGRRSKSTSNGKQLPTDMSSLRQDLARHSLNKGDQLGRFYAEIKFAETLCELHKSKAAHWRPLIGKAVADVQAVMTADGDVTTAIAAAEKTMAPIGKVAKTYTVHCIGHAHIDMNWKWGWPETVAVTHDTFSTVLRLMDEFPDFYFSQDQAAMYELTRRYNPEQFDAIRQRVKEGRWEITASHWVEGDKNMVGSETLCRHMLTTRQFMRRHFDLEPEDAPIDWQPDTFGHSQNVPNYLVQGGAKYFYTCYTSVDRPDVFWWQGADGARVLVRRDFHNYNGYIDTESVDRLIAYAKRSGLRDYPLVYGVGNHGGGPTRCFILAAREMTTWPIYPNFTMGRARDWFELIERTAGPKLPVFPGELNFRCEGCYTSNAGIKRRNRRAEAQLGDAEAAAAIDWLTSGRPYPGERLETAWQDTLFQHFHDILPGCNVHMSQEYNSGKFQETVAATGMIETQALRHLAAQVDTSDPDVEIEPGVPPLYMRYSRGPGVGFESEEGRISQFDNTDGGWPRKMLIFNPTGHERRELGTATVWETDVYCSYGALDSWGGGSPKSNIDSLDFSVRTPSGKTIPGQLVDTAPYWYCRWAQVVFPMEPVAGFGYGTYTILPEASDTPVAGAVTVDQLGRARNFNPTGGGWVMANEHVRVHVGSLTGAIHSLVDKASGVDVVDPDNPAGMLAFYHERHNAATGWIALDNGAVSRPHITKTECTARGPYIARVTISWTIAHSEFTTTYELRHDDPNLYITIHGMWREWGNEERGAPALDIAFPVDLQAPRARYEIPFGSTERPDEDGGDVPALRWAKVSGKSGSRAAGCLLLNDCKHGHSLTGNVLRVGLIRGTYDPDPMPEMGEHKATLALRPFGGRLGNGEATRAAMNLNHPLRFTGTDNHAGPLPATMNSLTASPSGVVVQGFKKAEDSDAIVVRLLETEGRKTKATLRFAANAFGRLRKAEAADALERPLKGAKTVTRKGNTVTVEIPAHSFATVLVYGSAKGK